MAEQPNSGAVGVVLSITCKCGEVVARFSDSKAGAITCSKGHPLGYYGGATAANTGPGGMDEPNDWGPTKREFLSR